MVHESHAQIESCRVVMLYIYKNIWWDSDCTHSVTRCTVPHEVGQLCWDLPRDIRRCFPKINVACLVLKFSIQVLNLLLPSCMAHIQTEGALTAPELLAPVLMSLLPLSGAQAAQSTAPILHGIAKKNAPGKGWGSAMMQIKQKTACGKDKNGGWRPNCKNPFCSVCCKEQSNEFQLSLMLMRM